MQNIYNKNNYKRNNNKNYGNFNKKDNNNNKKINNLKIDETVKYINPYNFITLPKECKRISEKERRGNLTGYIECVLTTKTPTMIPDTNEVEEVIRGENKKLKKYKFLNYGEINKNGNFTIPIISGSEIRGMLRTDYEIFTDSCMSTLNDDVKFISRTQNAKNPGILVKDNSNKWHLYKAVRYSLHTCRKGKGEPRNLNGKNEAIYFVNDKNQIKIGDKIYKTGDRVKFSYKDTKSAQIVLSIGNGNTEGILFIGELGGSKDLDKSGKNNIHDSIFVKQDTEVSISNIEESIDDLKEIFGMYNDKAFNQKIRGKDKIWYAGYDIENSNILPVWYSNPDDKNRSYLSLSAIGKEAYHRKLHELVGQFMPCIDKNKICNACNMFGFVAEEKEENTKKYISDAISSKIRISDAIYQGDENPYYKTIITKELAGPHIANASFYALYAPNTQKDNQPQNFDFNYDFVNISSKKTEDIKNGEITIRGRKMYWHHDDIERNIIKNPKEITERNCEITPVKSNISFKFKIYFNNINQENLNELIAVINLKYKNLDLCHKIGKAKPLGFGSCKIEAQNVYIRNLEKVNGKLEYSMVNYEKYFNTSSVKDITLDLFDMTTLPMQEALRIYDFNYIKNNYKDALVQYPIGVKKGKEASMYWFMLNKVVDQGKNYILMVLPRIIDGKNENGEEKEVEIKINEKKFGKTKGLILPKITN